MSKIKLFSILSMVTLGGHMTTTPTHAQALGPQKKHSTIAAMFSKRKRVENRQASIGIRMVTEIVGGVVLGCISIFVSSFINLGILDFTIPGIEKNFPTLTYLLIAFADFVGITKGIFGLEIVDAKGVPLTIDKLFIRVSIKYGINIFNCIGLFIGDGRLLHNKFVDCYVVYKKK